MLQFLFSESQVDTRCVPLFIFHVINTYLLSLEMI